MTMETIMTGDPAPPEPARTTRVDSLEVRVYQDRAALGAAAAASVAAEITAALRDREQVRIAFAAAPSQDDFLAALAGTPGIEWGRVTAFQLDDYVGLAPDAPQRFAAYLRSRIFDAVRPGTVHLFGAPMSSPEAGAECGRYTALVAAAPFDIVCLGIGENGHLAFNDPPVARFDDPERVKLVELDESCRRQQVNDGCFAALDHVPTHAITLTIPTLMGGRRIVCVVPGPTKRPAVHRALTGPIETACPASILRTHPAATLYLDSDSDSDSDGT